MATHSSIPDWRIPQTEEPGSLQSMGLQELDSTQQLNHHNVNMESDIEVICLQGKSKKAKNTRSHQKLGERYIIHSFSESSEGINLACTLTLGLWPSELRERKKISCFKPPSLWQFVTSDLGNIKRVKKTVTEYTKIL